MTSYTIREIEPGDNQQVKSLIQRVLVEMGVPKVGTAYEDASLDNMAAAYDRPRTAYFVIAEEGTIIGSAGIAPLEGGSSEVCELQKMYFLPQARGRGAGSEMIQKCLNFAQGAGFTKCYLETLPYMERARKLYARSGFQSLEGPMGNTGHYNCTLWMIKDIAKSSEITETIAAENRE